MRIELPFPLPTWNRILAMHPWERKKLRDQIHRMTLLSTQYERPDQTLTVSPQKQSLMDLLKQEYLQMIRPTKSKASSTRKNRAKKRRQSSRLTAKAKGDSE